LSEVERSRIRNSLLSARRAPREGQVLMRATREGTRSAASFVILRNLLRRIPVLPDLSNSPSRSYMLSFPRADLTLERARNRGHFARRVLRALSLLGRGSVRVLTRSLRARIWFCDSPERFARAETRILNAPRDDAALRSDPHLGHLAHKNSLGSHPLLNGERAEKSEQAFRKGSKTDRAKSGVSRRRRSGGGRLSAWKICEIR
jgi:hypothetical protein